MKSVSGATKVIAVIGDPISHSASPKMHNKMIQHTKLDSIYVPFHVKPENLKVAIKSISALNILGFNVTVPHKEKVLDYLDELDPLAQKIGAVNTIINKNNKLIGYNTDGEGFLLALNEELNFNFSDKNIVVIGAGGSAKSIIFSLSQQNIKTLTILNRTLSKAKDITEKLDNDTVTQCFELSSTLTENCQKVLNQADLVINTTSIGMYPNVNMSPLPHYDWAHQNQYFYDIIYNPKETRFLIEAKKKHATILNGLSMLAGQGKLAFELFTGTTADYFLMKKEIE